MTSALVLWTVSGLVGLALMLHARRDWNDLSIAPQCVLLGMFCLLASVLSYSEWRHQRLAAIDVRIQAEYEEVLRLIEWTPREMSPLEQVEEELRLWREVGR